MFERFTDQARQVVVSAQDAARELGHNHIGTEHILLGLLVNSEGLPAQVLASFGINADDVRTRVIDMVGLGEGSGTGQIPFTPRAKKVLELSLREALSLGHNHIGSGHVLLGLVREDEGVASRILLDLDVTSEELRTRMVERLQDEPASEAPPAHQPPPVRRAGGSLTVRFSVEPDMQLQRLLMAAGGRALADAREQFGITDLLAVIRELPNGRELLDDRQARGEGGT